MNNNIRFKEGRSRRVEGRVLVGGIAQADISAGTCSVFTGPTPLAFAESDRLGLEPPHLPTMRKRDLEVHLGTDLFERAGRAVKHDQCRLQLL